MYSSLPLPSSPPPPPLPEQCWLTLPPSDIPPPAPPKEPKDENKFTSHRVTLWNRCSYHHGALHRPPMGPCHHLHPLGTLQISDILLAAASGALGVAYSRLPTVSEPQGHVPATSGDEQGVRSHIQPPGMLSRNLTVRHWFQRSPLTRYPRWPQ